MDSDVGVFVGVRVIDGADAFVGVFVETDDNVSVGSG